MNFSPATTDADPAGRKEPNFKVMFPASALRGFGVLLQKTWLRLTLLVTAVIVVHLPSLQGQLIWDDNYLVGENPFFRSPIFSVEVFRHYLFLDSLSGHYRPTQNLSYIVDYLLWGGDVYGYHLSNVLWHAGAAVLLFLLLRRVLPTLTASEARAGWSDWGAYLIALLWALHPVHSAAVDYISGRADSLAFVFSCGAWLVCLRAEAGSRRITRTALYVLAALLLLLGLCAREIACIWVALFLIHRIFYAVNRANWRTVATVSGCLLVVAVYAVLRTLPERRALEPASSNWSAVSRSGLMLRALGDYARLTVWPTGLHMERSVTDPRMHKAGGDWRDQFAFSRLSMLGFVAVAALAIGAFKRGRGRNLRIFGALWFTAGFLPISNLVELNATSAEHWLYLPLVGLLLVFVGWGIELPRPALRVAFSIALLAAVALGVRSTLRSSDWISAKVFYERTIAAAGWSPRVGLNLAIIYKGEGRYEEARALLERTLRAWPDYPLARSHLASTLLAMGEDAQGGNLLAVAAAAAPEQGNSYPRTWVAAYQLANREYRAGQNEHALELLADARTRAPKAWPLVELESEILRKTSGPKAALPLVERFTQACWWQYQAYLALGKLRAQENDAAGALAALRHACRLDIRETDALNLIARIELGAKNFSAALLAQERAISRQPDEPSQYLLYSEVLLQMGRVEQAEKARKIAERLKNTHSA